MPVDGISLRANSRYYVGHALDGGAVSVDGLTVKMGPYYIISEGVKGNKEGGAKTMMKTTKTTMSTMMTETASLLLPPPGRNTIKFVIGNAGDNSVDSWVFLRAGSFRCVALGGEVHSRQ